MIFRRGLLQPSPDLDDQTVAVEATLRLIEDIDQYTADPAAHTNFDDFQLMAEHIETIDVVDL